MLTTPSKVLPLHFKQTFLPIIWIFTEDQIQSTFLNLFYFRKITNLKELVRQESHIHRRLQWGHHNFVVELIFWPLSQPVKNSFLRWWPAQLVTHTHLQFLWVVRLNIEVWGALSKTRLCLQHYFWFRGKRLLMTLPPQIWPQIQPVKWGKND